MPPDENNEARLPLTPDFQSWVLRQICDDRGFASVALPYLKPSYFDSPVEAWAFARVAEYRAQYEMPCPLSVVIHYAHCIEDPGNRTNTVAHLVTLANHPPLLPDVAAWLRDQVLSFVRRQFFRETIVQAVSLFDDQKRENDAQDYAIKRMAELSLIAPTTRDRSAFFEELEGRLKQRAREDDMTRVPTGLPQLDKILDGGLGKGEVGLWMAYAKNGKTTMLTNLGAAGCRAFRKVLHLVYEGRRQQVEARYDAIFAGFAYRAVRKGEIPPEVLDRMRAEYKALQGNLIIRGFTSAEDNAWNCSVQTVIDELAYLKSASGWVPDLIVIDYGDLLQCREKGARTATERQTLAYQDIKTLAGQGDGYAIWTASQPQRPGEDSDTKPHLLKSRQIADAYSKVRTCDFIGSINMSNLEREHKVARLYAELYRDNAADHEFTVRCDLSTMTIREEANLVSPHAECAAGPTQSAFGYLPKAQQLAGF